MPPSRILTLRLSELHHQIIEDIATREGKEKSDVIRAALRDKYPADFKDQEYKEGRPSLMPGWKSRLYQDRYQLVATWTGKDGFDFCHFHELDTPINKSRQFGIIRAETPAPIEIYILDVPSSYEKEDIAEELQLALLEWWGVQEDQGKL